jgi:hypothetical protein
VAIVWRGGPAAESAGLESNERLRPVVEAFAAAGAEVTAVVYRDAAAGATREALLAQDAVVAWVDPIGGGEDRQRFDRLLREVADAGVLVGSHPDTIDLIGTKEVLYDTRQLGWGTDTHRYATFAELRGQLRGRLATGPRVLKPRRGNGGIGVYRVELVDHDSSSADPAVAVHGAEVRDLHSEVLSLTELLARCAPCFADGGSMIDQPFLPRVAEGLIRTYLVGDAVVGFALQSADALIEADGDEARVMGLPSPKTMLPPEEPGLQRLRRLVEVDWVPGLCELLGLEPGELPVLWDADFLLGPPEAGVDTYVLCEINASCITPYPPQAIPALVEETFRRLDGPARRSGHG